MTPLSCELLDLHRHLLQVAGLMRATPDPSGHHQRHADELAGAADICRDWIKAAEDASHD